MTDPADVLDQWLKDNEQQVPCSWGREIPFEGESVPGGVGNEVADAYADCRDAGLSDADAMAVADDDSESFTRASLYVQAVRAGASNTDAVLYCISATRRPRGR